MTVPAETDPQVIYDRLVTLVMRQGNWLSSPQAQLLTPAEWERQFARYQEQLEELRRLGDELRASRSTGVRLAGRGGAAGGERGGCGMVCRHGM